MAYESKYNIDKRCVFRETFNNEEDVIKNGGTPANVVFDNGTAYFNGTNAYINYPAKNIGKEFSIRFRLNVIENYSHFVFSGGLRSASGSADGFYFVINNRSTTKSAYIANKGGVLLFTSYIFPASLEGWHWFTFTFSKTDNFIKLYLDDNLIDTKVYNSNFDKLLNEYITIGAIKYDNLYRINTLDLFEIYNKALTEEEISNLYNKTSYKDVRDGLILDIDARGGVIEDKMGNALTNTGVTIINDNGYKLKFSGTTKLTIPISITTKYTSCLWFKILNYTNGANGRYIVTCSNCYPQLNTVRIFVYSNGDIASWNQPDLPIIKDIGGVKGTEWHFVAATFDINAGEHKLYTDGVLVSSGPAINAINMSSIMYGYSFKGNANNLRVYNRVLSAEEIARLFSMQKNNYI